MSAQNVHNGDVGTIFRLTVLEDGVVVDISSQTSLTIFLGAPSGTKTKVATLTTDGTDGKLQYTSIAGDIDEAGRWSYQGKIVIASGTFYTVAVEFIVEPVLG